MIEEQVISFELAQLAKEKGFDLEVCDFYDTHKKTLYVFKKNEYAALYKNYNNPDAFSPHTLSAPSQSLLQTWLRRKHNISVLVEHGRTQSDEFGYFTRVFPNTISGSGQFKVFEYRTQYENALDAGLMEAVNLIKIESRLHNE